LTRNRLTFSLLTSLLLFLFFYTASAPRPVMASGGSTDADLPLCLPGAVDSLLSDCLNAGPAARLQSFASLGLTFPQTPITGQHTPYELSLIPFTYARVVDESVPLYSSIESAVENKPNGNLAAGRLKFVSLINKSETKRGLFYQTSTLDWISADFVKKVGVPGFRGLVFDKNPTGVFGWIKLETKGRTTPDPAVEPTGKDYWREDLIRVYDTKKVGDVEWVMVGPNEWIEHRYIGRVLPNYNTPKGVTGNRWIEVNLYEQVLTVYENGQLLFATLITSGSYPFYTQPGVFPIYEKFTSNPMWGAFEADRSDYYYLEDVPYIMYYDQKRALHGSYWNQLIGLPASHGCVNLSVSDAHWLFNWANLGDPVYVWDPSGKTPTDPSFYGAGGV
jgi:hypothetical protein